MNGCDFLQHQDVCTARVERIDVVGELVHQALERASALERAQRSCDLFALSGLPGELDFWWGVHRACGIEYRRLMRIFWRCCPHFWESAA